MTMRHIVSAKMKAETSEERAARTAEVEALFEKLREIPSVRQLSIHRNEQGEGRNFDLALIVDYDDEAGLAEYTSHPIHLGIIEDLVAATDGIAVVDFTV